MFNHKHLLKDFPILKRKINGKPLIYFDNAATSLTPNQVLTAMNDYYTKYNANVHRGIHTLSEEATEKFEAARDTVQKFIGASHREEIVFTSGATESLNLLAYCLAPRLKKGQEIIVTEAEHHSNFVPWQMLAKKQGLKLKFIPVNSPYTPSLSNPPAGRAGRGKGGVGELDLTSYKKLLGKKTALVTVTQASNVLGSIYPVEKMVRLAQKYKAITVVDAAQSIPHIPINVKKINCDFLVFSGHKMLAPNGVGVLYGKKEFLETMPPYKTGGHMIEKVSKNHSTFAPLPQKFEAGTMPIAEVIGLGAAIEYLQKIGSKKLMTYESTLTAHAIKKFGSIKGLQILGSQNSMNRLAVVSFVLSGVPSHDIASLLDEQGIAVRAGHSCAQILHEKFGISSSVRASLYFYNTKAEIDRLAKALEMIKILFSA